MSGEHKIDFSTWKRCKVISKSFTNQFLNLGLVLYDNQDIADNILINYPWNQVNVNPGDIISVMAQYDAKENSFLLSMDFGFLVVNPDYLVSSTKVAQSLFCQRKSVLSEKFKVRSVGNTNMIIGVLVHELFQTVLLSVLKDGIKPNVMQLCEETLNSRDLALMCFENSISIEIIKKPLMDYMAKINKFLMLHIKVPLHKNQNQNYNKPVCAIDKINDIEENIWSPQLGLKGKVDVTVHLHGRPAHNYIPFELKTGKTSFSMEHKAQIQLYVAMMKEMNCDVNSGLLYYLQDNVFEETVIKHNEVRDLIMSRNELVHYLSKYETEPISSEYENSQNYRLMKLPDPITRESVCRKCEYNLICSTFYCHSPSSDANNSLQTIGQEILQHLSKKELDYFFKWTEILLMEERALREDQNTHELWTQTPFERFNTGKTLIDLKLEKVAKCLDGTYLHTFLLNQQHCIDHINFEISQCVILSTTERVAIATGTITQFRKDVIRVSIDRDLSLKYCDASFLIDKYSGYNQISYSYGYLAQLMEDTPVSNYLRKIIVNKLPSEYEIEWNIENVPNFNETQTMIIEKAVNCKNYMLIRGYAGSGKTEVIVAIIKALYENGKSILITSHTHSAIDNILLRLRNFGVEFMRIGKLNRIMPEIERYSEHILTKDCKTPEDFESVYTKYNVVAATCYGVTHALFSHRMFDICIVDEATQLTQPIILGSLLSAKRFVLIGDPFQLPPVMKSKAAKLLGGDESLFCWLNDIKENNEMNVQYRMNIKIHSLVNSLTYNKRLICANVSRMSNHTIEFKNPLIQFNWEKQVFSSSIQDSVLFIDIDDAYNRNMDLMKSKSFAKHMHLLTKLGHEINNTNKMYINLVEAIIVLHLTTKFLKCHVSTEDIGIIATYRSQVDCIKSLAKTVLELQGLEINTVDQYQGRDKKIILYSCAKTKSSSFKTEKTNENEILDDHRRLTVAVTRAKNKLIIVGDSSSIMENAPFEKLLTIISDEKIEIPSEFFNLQWDHLLRESKFLKHLDF